MTRILLIRHGQSTWNAEGRWQGRADPPLSELGRDQAAAAAAAIAAHGVRQVHASPLERAHETARILAGGLGLDIAVDPRWQERDAGAWQGCTRGEIDEGWPGYLEAGHRPVGFETDDVLHDRALAVLSEVAAAADHPVLVVSHGGLIRVVERALGSEPHRVPNLGGLEISVAGGRPSLAGRIVLVDPDAVTVTTPPEI